jgi:PAS domain S-box-containing protein
VGVTVYLSLIQNAALLVALSTLYGLLARARTGTEDQRFRVLSGLLFGAVAVAGMFLPYRYAPGIIYDGRSVIMAAAGLFGGGTGSAVAVIVAGAYRAYLGGQGVWAGLATIILCAAVGLAFRRLAKNQPERLGIVRLYALGVSAHVVMLLCQLLLLPWSVSLHVFRSVWLPVMLIFPVATVFVGLLLGNEEGRIQLTERLRETSERLNELGSHLEEVVWTASADGSVITSINEAFSAIYGMSPGRLEKASDLWLRMTHPDDVPVAQSSERDLHDFGHSQADYRIVRQDGEVRWVRDRKSVIRDGKGRVIAMGGLIADVTASVKAQEALRASEEQLRQSQKMEAIGQLAGGIAHDFNNLLTAIIGYSDLILALGDSLAAGVRDDVMEIRRAAERASGLTRQILAFSRRQALQPSRVKLETIIDDLEQLLRRTLGETIELVVERVPDLGYAQIDVHQFEQVVMNLAVNARDAMPMGGRLTLKTANAFLTPEFCQGRPDVEPGPYVVLTDTDTGVGMDDTTKSRACEPFFTTKPVGEGTGLGLSTVYGIVRQSGGAMDIESTLGEGTSIKIYLPAVQAPAAESPLSDHVSPAGFGGHTVLVVEDEEPLRRLIARVLESEGHEALLAEDSGQALKIVEEHPRPIGLLITDIVLPGGMRGDELAAVLTASYPGLPVLLISGYAHDAAEPAGSAGARVEYLAKPFSPQTLVDTVARMLHDTSCGAADSAL